MTDEGQLQQQGFHLNQNDDEESTLVIEPCARVRDLYGEDRPFGEAFESFYKWELLQKTGNRLSLLSQEKLRDISTITYINQIPKKRKKLILQRADALADSIYDLSNKKWEENSNAYLKSVDQKIDQLSCNESRYLLRSCQTIFKDKYGKKIRERGESVELIDQIVKRTGEETRAQFIKVFSSIDVTEVAWKLRDFLYSDNLDPKQKLQNMLLDLTDFQVRELRLEYNTTPAIILAREIHRALHLDPEEDIIPEEPPGFLFTGRSVFGDVEEDEEDFDEDFEDEQEVKLEEDDDEWDFQEKVEEVEEVDPYTIDHEAIIHVLKGRTKHEISLIEFHFNDIFQRRGGEPALKQQIKERMMSSKSEQIFHLLRGYNPEEEADKIYKILMDQECIAPYETVLDDRLVVGEESAESETDKADKPAETKKSKKELREQQARTERLLLEQILITGKWPLMPDMPGKLRRRFLEDSNPPNWQRELSSIMLLRDSVRHLLPEQFQEVNDILDKKYSLRLDPAYYHNGSAIDARALVEEIAHDLDVKKTVKDLLSSIEFLCPEDIAELRRMYSIAFDSDLLDDFRDKIRELYANQIPEDVEAQIENRLTGASRVRVRADLLAPFHPHNQSNFDSTSLHSQRSDALEEVKEYIESKSWLKVADLLRGLSYQQRTELEQAYYEDDDCIDPLRTILVSETESLEATESFFLLCGVEARSIAEDLASGNMLRLFDLRNHIPEAVDFVAYLCKQLHQIDLEALIEAYRPSEDCNISLSKDYIQMIYLAPEAYQLGEELLTYKPLSHEAEYLIDDILEKPSPALRNFELAFNRLFCDLRLLLKQLSSFGFCARDRMAEFVLNLEGIDPDAHIRFKKLIEFSDVASLKTSLRREAAHLKSIEDAHDVVFPDSKLRATLDQMNAGLNDICRTLLLLDCYDPVEVAAVIQQIIESNKGDTLTRKILKVLTPPDEKNDNPLIPEDMNWVDEMYLQIRHAYKETNNTELLEVLYSKGINDKQLSKIAKVIYGDSTSVTAKEIWGIMTSDKHSDQKLSDLISILGKINPRLRECVIALYDSYYSLSKGRPSLVGEIHRIAPEDTKNKKKVMKIISDSKPRKRREKEENNKR